MLSKTSNKLETYICLYDKVNRNRIFYIQSFNENFCWKFGKIKRACISRKEYNSIQVDSFIEHGDFENRDRNVHLLFSVVLQNLSKHTKQFHNHALMVEKC